MPDFGNPFSGMNSDRPLNRGELIRALRFSIAAEYEAIQLYTQLADSITDARAQKVLRDVADEEIVHAGEFMRILKDLNPQEESLYQDGEEEVAKMFYEKSAELKSIANQIDDTKIAQRLKVIANIMET